ncbi:hypothetical protein BYT27DRAFT_7185143 [Phlegmacium glaucopus]|nr:hypothetical protein BYT27DRAFT_7185143 [Phlegmacium glaucopus]
MGQLFSKRIRSEDISSDDIVIVVIGPSGVGKSTFINTAAEQSLLKVNRGLDPCTTKVEHVRCAIQFEGRTKQVVFVDTPAFPDPGDCDEMVAGLDVEMKIREWSKQTFGKKIKVTGVLYLHDITQNRMTQPPHQLFQKLCGDGFHARVLLVTTMWEKLKNLNDGERRRKTLEGHWREIIDRGSAVVRHHGTKESAWNVVQTLVG